MFTLNLKNGLVLGVLVGCVTAGGIMAQAATFAKIQNGNVAAKATFNPVAFTDSKGHYHPDWAIHGRP